MTFKPKQKQNKPSYKKQNRFNHTPKKQHKPKKNNVVMFRKKTAKKSQPTREYICTSCSRQVMKKHACGDKLDMGRPPKRAGLGRFKCVCGNKTVSVKRVKADVVKEKAAA